MNHLIYQVRAVEIVEPYTLRVQFTDDTDWPKHKDAFAARAREWERVSA